MSERWRIEGSSKVIAAIIVQKSEKDMGQVVSLGTGNRYTCGAYMYTIYKDSNIKGDIKRVREVYISWNGQGFKFAGKGLKLGSLVMIYKRGRDI